MMNLLHALRWVGVAVCLCLLHSTLCAQAKHYDYLGGGHSNGVTVTVSSATGSATGQATVDGFAVSNEQQLKEASRFLAQATFGADMATIKMAAAMGYDAWLTEQFALPQASILPMMVQHRNYNEADEADGNVGDVNVPIWSGYFRSAWFDLNMKTPDLLRQRMAYNLSQIMVVNDNSDFFMDVGQTIGGYYDLLGSHVFGNYKSLLTDVTLSPVMGNFLSHYNNPKADPANNIHPDENYAREIMQLFSIGLWELHPNGTRKFGPNGQWVPTYTNDDIKEFAQVFTGLGSGLANGEFGAPIDDADEDNVRQVTTPMKMYEAYHDNSEKHLLNGLVLPAGQAGMTDINQTVNHLATHPNTAPFICTALIKMLTTSNPSTNYVGDVAAVFDPNEAGNFQKVIRAILLHPEARDCDRTETYTFGKLREPVVRLMNFFKAFPINVNTEEDEEDFYFYEMVCYGINTGQSPFAAPSVFNFYLPDYAPQGPITQNYLVAPEFQILNASNAIGLVNEMNNKIVKGIYFYPVCNVGDEPPDIGASDAFIPTESRLFVTQELNLAATDPAALVAHLDVLLANGGLSASTRTIITEAIAQLPAPEDRLRLAIYLVMISPDYAILK